jgi:hypothetical protein
MRGKAGYRRSCFILPSGTWISDISAAAWFGLLEYRSEKIPDSRFGARHYYRKAALFDRLLTFDVKMEFAKGPVTDGLEAGYELLVLLTADEKVRPPAACSRTKKSGQ